MEFPSDDLRMGSVIFVVRSAVVFTNEKYVYITHPYSLKKKYETTSLLTKLGIKIVNLISEINPCQVNEPWFPEYIRKPHHILLLFLFANLRWKVFFVIAGIPLFFDILQEEQLGSSFFHTTLKCRGYIAVFVTTSEASQGSMRKTGLISCLRQYFLKA